VADQPDTHTDVLPEDLNAVDVVRPHSFPDNSRRRIPGAIYLVSGLAVILGSSLSGSDAILWNSGLTAGGVLLAVVGLMGIASGWRMRIDEHDALARSGAAVGFAIGHASAQQVWRGIRSRPTWRVLCYSDEDPPRQRGLVLVDAIDGHVVQVLVQPCDEDWDAFSTQ
jgi:hypothetical protein